MQISETPCNYLKSWGLQSRQPCIQHVVYSRPAEIHPQCLPVWVVVGLPTKGEPGELMVGTVSHVCTGPAAASTGPIGCSGRMWQIIIGQTSAWRGGELWTSGCQLLLFHLLLQHLLLHLASSFLPSVALKPWKRSIFLPVLTRLVLALMIKAINKLMN